MKPSTWHHYTNPLFPILPYLDHTSTNLTLHSSTNRTKHHHHSITPDLKQWTVPLQLLYTPLDDGPKTTSLLG